MKETPQQQRLKVLSTLFEGYEGPAFGVRLWDGWCWNSPGDGPSVATIIFYSSHALRSLLIHPSEVTLGEAFIEKEIDVEGDLFSVFEVAEYIFHCTKSKRQQILEVISGLFLGLGEWWADGRTHSTKRDKKSISYHYDQPPAFYQPWLGPTMVYSCAYFHAPTDSIDLAQQNKLELICRKLRLTPGERFLDIGCGWGSLLLHAATHHNVFAQGITLSQQQANFAKHRIHEARLDQCCRVNLLDYRQAPERFEAFQKIASIGMFEHVGVKNLSHYFNAAYHMLKPGGVFLNHGIARSQIKPDTESSFLNSTIIPFLRDTLMLHPPRSATFIGKYVFPDGELSTIAQATSSAEAVGFEVRDVENLREHYALTLRCWVNQLREQQSELLKIVPEKTYRIWLLYMAGSAAAFRRGDIGVYQTLLSRPEHGNSHLPLTREEWYQTSMSQEGVMV